MRRDSPPSPAPGWSTISPRSWRRTASASPLLVGQPIVSAAHLRDRLEAPSMSVQRALAQLAEVGVLQEATGRSRNRVWQHRGILAVLDDYAEQVRRRG